jgi:minor extracellular serine protease Vpr
VRRLRLAVAAALTAALVIAGPAAASVSNGRLTDGSTASPTVAKGYALVQLKGAPLATYTKTKPAPGKKVDFSSAQVKSRKAHLAALRNDFKFWLRKNAPKAQIVKGYDLSLNAVSVKLNGTSLATLRKSDMVVRAQFQGIYHPTADTDPDLAAISALAGWAVAGVTSEDAGAGVKVGVIDSGIDITHSCFSDLGYDNHFQLGDKRFTNNKVIVARVFNNKANQGGYTAEAIEAHGTHVAGTIACNWDTSASVSGAEIPHGISGVAPRALLGNYNVFPGTVENARSEDILNAIEAAYRDGMDIVNMSLGGGASGIQDLLTKAVDNLDKANMVFTISAGNEGPGHYTVGSPGSAARALTAGASTVNHEVANPVTAGSATSPGVLGDFGIPDVYPFVGTLRVLMGSGSTAGVSGLDLACAPIADAPDASSVALIQRGVCDFSLKLYNVQQAGYTAAVVVNRIGGAPIAMGKGSAPADPTIPGVMISMDDVDAFKAEDGSTVSIGEPAYVYPYFDVDVMADFSSQGPTDVDFRVKPDVVAPGVNILSSVPTAGCGGDDCFAFYQGTSMAAPHLAGVAAIIAQQHPDWPAWAIRSAVVNSADTGVLEKYTLDGPVTDVQLGGAGRVNLESAASATVLLDPVSISFGATPAGSGVTKTVRLRITNAGDAAAIYSVAIAPYGSAKGVTFSTSVANVALDAGDSAVITVKAVFAKKAPRGDKQAWLVLSDGTGMVAHAAVYARVK